MGFGNSSQTWAISPDDFKLSELDEGECLGAFFELSGGGSAPPWIIGDTFLVSQFLVVSCSLPDELYFNYEQKNVYSVFRYQPPSVGFAQLSGTAVDLNGASEAVPSPTSATTTATVSASSTPSPTSVDVSSACTLREHSRLWALVVSITAALIGMFLTVQ